MPTIWTILNSPLGVAVIVGFGADIIRRQLQREVEIREQKLEWLKKTKEEQKQLMDNLTSLIGKQFFGLLRVYWALKNDKDNQSEINKCWKQHKELMKEWEENLFSNRICIQRLATTEIANDFFCLEKTLEKNSLHGSFKEIQNKLSQERERILEHADSSSEDTPIENDFDTLNAEIDKLKMEIDNFLNNKLNKEGFSQNLKTVKEHVV